MTQNISISMKSVLLSSNPFIMIQDIVEKSIRNIGKFFSKVIPAKTISMETIKQDVWKDLSTVYYKYEDSAQKRAFREILLEISDRINEGKWDTVYRKLYSIESTQSTSGPI